MSKTSIHAVVRRVEETSQSPKSLTHNEAFKAAYGPKTCIIKAGALHSKTTEDAGQRAAACISACDGLSLRGLKDNGIAELVAAAQSTVRVLSDRLVRIDPQAELSGRQLAQALRKLGVKG